MSNVSPIGVDRLDKDLTIGQMQGKAFILLLFIVQHITFLWPEGPSCLLWLLLLL